jgi:hypothetical protein
MPSLPWAHRHFGPVGPHGLASGRRRHASRETGGLGVCPPWESPEGQFTSALQQDRDDTPGAAQVAPPCVCQLNRCEPSGFLRQNAMGKIDGSNSTIYTVGNLNSGRCSGYGRSSHDRIERIGTDEHARYSLISETFSKQPGFHFFILPVALGPMRIGGCRDKSVR